MTTHNSSSHWVKVKFLEGEWWIGFMFGLGAKPHQDTVRIYRSWDDASRVINAWVISGRYPEER